MTDPVLLEARQKREEQLLLSRIDENLDILLAHVDEGWEHRHSLRALLAYYAQSATPYQTCVKLNMKRFGPGRTEKTCGTIKDLLRGTHNYNVALSDDATQPEFTEELADAIDQIPEKALINFFGRVADDGS